MNPELRPALTIIWLALVSIVLAILSGQAIVDLVAWALQSRMVALSDIGEVVIDSYLLVLAWSQLRREWEAMRHGELGEGLE